jgi:PIN domain nuclease of toxin-antitoxin system
VGSEPVIVLDTHAWFWWLNEPSRLSRRAAKAIDEADDLGVCGISLWELAMLVAARILVFETDPIQWLEAALAVPRVALLHFTPAIAMGSVRLEGFHRDPADRIIVATALANDSPLVTKDERIRRWEGVRTIW